MLEEESEHEGGRVSGIRTDLKAGGGIGEEEDVSEEDEQLELDELDSTEGVIMDMTHNF